MTRIEYMKRLEILLAGISAAEREEALQFYTDYFDEAGEENEQEVIASLGTPEMVAAKIKAGLNGASQGEYTERGFSDGNDGPVNEITKRERKKEKRKLASWEIALILLACIVFSPLILGGAGTILGLFLGAIGLFFGLIVAAFAIVIAMIIAGVAFVAIGIGSIASGAFIPGGCLIGIGLMAVAVFLFVLWLIVVTNSVFLPALIRLIKKGWQKLFGKGGKVA